MTQFFYLLKNTIQKFIKDNAGEMAAALSFYTLFAIPSVILISLNIVNIVFTNVKAREILLSEINGTAGSSVTDIFANLILHLDRYSYQASIASWIGIISLVIAGGGAFAHIHRSLNKIWNLTTHPSRNVLLTLRKRLTAIFILGTVGILALISIILNTYYGFIRFEKHPIVSPNFDIFQMMINLLFYFSMVLITAFIFNMVPDAKISWKDSLIGAFFTSLLALAGRYIIGIVLQSNTFDSIYGAAGSLLVLLIWIYYLANIFFFGAEFTRVFSHLHGSGIKLSKGIINRNDSQLPKKG